MALLEGRAMPLLPLEPYLFPGDLFEDPAPVVNSPERWWVLHSRPRAEKALARQLLARSLPFFLPLHHRQWRSRGRLQSSYLPLFPGYVFLRGDDDGRVAALTTNLVAHVLPVPDQNQLVADLIRVNHLIVSGSPLTPEDRLEPGTLVEITAGPFAGMEGKILRSGKNLRFFVEVQFLQRGVSVEIESWMFQPILDQHTRLSPVAHPI
jgi:transcriptional antiterminator RfaH